MSGFRIPTVLQFTNPLITWTYILGLVLVQSFEQQNWNNIKLTQWGSKNWPFEIRKHLKAGVFYCPVFWMAKKQDGIYFDPQQKGQRLLKLINDMLYVVGNVSWTCQPQKFSKSEFKKCFNSLSCYTETIWIPDSIGVRYSNGNSHDLADHSNTRHFGL